MKTFHQNVPLELSSGATAKEAAQSLHLTEPHQGLAVTINDQLSDLSTHLKEGDKLKFYQFEDPEGKEVFWHTSAHVLAQAVLRLYPQALPTIGPPIDHGFYYDFANLHLSEEDFLKVEKEIKTILAENFRPERVEFKNKKEALEAFGKNPYKKELIESFDELAPITAYRQGEFFDLCRGPHLPNIGKIKAFKLLKTSGAYWRGDSSKEMLTRVYAISFPTKEELSRYLFVLEEAKRRDHRLIAAKLDLFSFKEEAHAMPFIHPKGLRIWDSLISYWKELHEEAGYEMIKTPQLLSKELWERSGHWEHYQENMFICQEKEEKSFALKPMNCPGCMLYYLGKPRSYRDLPWRVGEIGHVHRREPSGALNGLFRVQSFHQDDAHIFMKPEDISGEIIAILHLVSKIYQAFGLDHRIELSTRPKKSIGTDRDWEIATKGLKDALDFWGHIYKINEGDGAFYGPKIDFHVQDAIGRSWQCGTIQLDMALPEKFDLHYMDQEGKNQRPIMIHRAIYGSIERFMAILIEHFAGKFPLWLSPLPIRLLPVADRHLPYAEEVKKKITAEGFFCDIDTSAESVGKKVRTAQLLQINYMLTVGDKEIENHTINIRTRDNVVHGEISLSDFLKVLIEEKKSRQLTSPYEQIPAEKK